MSDNIQFKITIPLDDEGMLGRECLKCEKYFKLKPGTGLPSNYCHCPYCDYEGDGNTFFTIAQNDYMQSIALSHAMKTVIKPSLDRLTNTFRELERKTRNNSFLRIKVSVKDQNLNVPIKHYKEEELETKLTCDNCGLIFSVYGVFARCPDCSDFNTFQIYEKSLEVAQKQLIIFTDTTVPRDLREQSIGFILIACVSTFDSMGKDLRSRNPNLYPAKPKNLFQNLIALNQALDNHLSQNHSQYDLVYKMFQVRHLVEHNMGVIDNDFVRKVPAYTNKLGQKYPLNKTEIEEFIKAMEELGELIKTYTAANS